MSDYPDNMPSGLQYRTADEIAECFDYHKHLTKPESDALYLKLWGFLSESVEAGKSTPLGGDGTNGTVEYPDARWGTENTDKTHHWWSKLTEREQQAIIKCCD